MEDFNKTLKNYFAGQGLTQKENALLSQAGHKHMRSTI